MNIPRDTKEWTGTLVQGEELQPLGYTERCQCGSSHHMEDYSWASHQRLDRWRAKHDGPFESFLVEVE